MTEPTAPLAAFAGYGIEMEFMIVHHDTLSVLPVTDEVLRAVAGEYVGEIEQGPLAWSNELVLHVIEIKTNGPAARLAALPDAFHADIRRIDALLVPLGGRLMPGAMHPWMDPHQETRLWPHEYNAVYAALDRIFDCRGHGWSNLQSVHINLPFADDRELERLHAAVRALLPILPALAASSPIAGGKPTGLLDTRLEVYRGNCRKIPSITGRLIPDTVVSRDDYEEKILTPMYRDIAPHDPGGILRHEWLNARGAIARFDRNAIEIRVLDIQDCPLADLATAAAIIAVLKALYAGRWSSLTDQQTVATAELSEILLATMRAAERTVIESQRYLDLFQFPSNRCEARELWYHLIEGMPLQDGMSHAPWSPALKLILDEGPLARRILRSVGEDIRHDRLVEVYRELCDCLLENRQFRGID